MAPTLAQPLLNAELSIFPVADGVVEYFGVGSGAGQKAFLNNDSTQLRAGLSATVHFANSDAPLSTSQITSYQAGRAKTDGPLIQIPYLITPITIPLVNPSTDKPNPVGSTGSEATGPSLPNSTTPTVALNDADLCGIFSGAFTNWSQVTNPGNLSTYPAAPITVVCTERR